MTGYITQGHHVGCGKGRIWCEPVPTIPGTRIVECMLCEINNVCVVVCVMSSGSQTVISGPGRSGKTRPMASIIMCGVEILWNIGKVSIPQLDAHLVMTLVCQIACRIYHASECY